MTNQIKYILASNSPRRRELLEQMGMDFEVQAYDVDESTALTDPAEIVLELSKKKAEAYFNHLPFVEYNVPGWERIVIAADTIVCVNQNILGKPETKEEAYRMLNLLSGKSHQVYTGVTIAWTTPGKDPEKCYDKYTMSFYEKTDVFVKEMSDQEIRDYIATEEPMDKAGAYGIQGIFAKYIDHIEGDYNNVVGLPTDRLKKELDNLADTKKYCAYCT